MELMGYCAGTQVESCLIMAATPPEWTEWPLWVKFRRIRNSNLCKLQSLNQYSIAFIRPSRCHWCSGIPALMCITLLGASPNSALALNSLHFVARKVNNWQWTATSILAIQLKVSHAEHIIVQYSYICFTYIAEYFLVLEILFSCDHRSIWSRSASQCFLRKLGFSALLGAFHFMIKIRKQCSSLLKWNVQNMTFL